MGQFRHRALLLILLLAGSFLRLHDLPQTPPGMTHDEADHGMDAWGVVEGDRPLYFTVGYGREPFYDYSTAVLMSFLGPTYLAGRLASVFFSLILVAGAYAWVRRAFDRRLALLTAAGLAVAFWPVMVARHALRTVTMPALFVLVTLLFWRAAEATKSYPRAGRPRRLLTFTAAGAILGLTFYTYFPARVMWVLFPAFLAFLALLRRPLPWRGTALMLLVAGAIAAPLFAFLATHPEAEARLDQLATPLEAATEGSFEPLFDNALASLRTFTFTGDTLWRYNVPGRPLLPWAIGLFFYAGVVVAAVCVVRALWRAWRQRGKAAGSTLCPPAPALFMALAWLAGGFSPALITGPEASTTRVAAMLPVLYLFPAVGLTALSKLAARATRRRLPWLLPLSALLLFSFLFVDTAHTYFNVWGAAPAVHVQYEANVVRAVTYLNDRPPTPAAISTNEPDRFHDPATARMFLRPALFPGRWFDGRHSLLLPGGDETLLLITPEAPLHPMLADYVKRGANESRILPAPTAGREGIVVYHVKGHGTDVHWQDPQSVDKEGVFHTLYPQFSPETPALSTELSTAPTFGGVVSFLGQQTPATARPGDTIVVAALWRVDQSTQDELVAFSHLLPSAGDGQPLAQADRLDVPSAFWQEGDVFVQLHEIHLPADLPAGDYPLDVGFYPRADWRQRLPLSLDGEPAGDALRLATITVSP